jgi:hypothetical protein
MMVAVFTTFRAGAVSIATRDNETIQHRAGVGAPCGNNVVAIVITIGEIKSIIALEVTAENGFVSIGVTLVDAGFRSGKPAEKPDTIFQTEARLACACPPVRRVSTGGYPYLRVRLRQLQSIL